MKKCIYCKENEVKKNRVSCDECSAMKTKAWKDFERMFGPTIEVFLNEAIKNGGFTHLDKVYKIQKVKIEN